ncbi:hypothetical protein Q5P01_024207 [Channa striata]|uniref:CWH43-like N-terminal domain-containing protein n=1 Tax=Channa striata TaxID=64152 RepID=A0AA88IPY3_CHASR|nr:hypothetical protein Q5P01_024207 [Channa striata]
MWSCSPWAFLPLTYSVCTAAGLWLVYLLAVESKSIAPLGLRQWKKNESLYPPYISNAGDSPPASCIFSLVMNLAAFTGFIIGVLRYLQLKHRLNTPWLNMCSVLAFSGSCVGMTLVGNFQNSHFGHVLDVGMGLLFCWIQSFLSLKAKVMNEGKKVGILRFFLSGSITFCMILTFFLMSQGIYIHAARCQWALAMFFLVFLGTFTVEFGHYRFLLECTENPGNPVRLQENLPEVTVTEPNQM